MGGYTVWHIDGTDSEERNNAVHLEMHMPSTVRNVALASLVVRILGPRFYDELRTKQQLGYSVQMTWNDQIEFVAVVCSVQSEYPPDYVRSRIDEFLNEQLHWVETELDEMEFLRQRGGLVSILAEAPVNLQEEFDEYWSEISLRRYDFRWREQRRQAAEGLDLVGLRTFARSVVFSAPRLYVEVHSICDEGGTSAPKPTTLAAKPDRLWRGWEDSKEFRRVAHWVALSANATSTKVS